MRGLALAPSWLTVLPVHAGAPDPRTAAWALRWAPVAGALVGAAAGRAAFAWVARRGVRAARPGGLGATVAESQPWWVAVLWWAALAICGYALAGLRGPLAIALSAAVVAVVSRHTSRRFGGMTG